MSSNTSTKKGRQSSKQNNLSNSGKGLRALHDPFDISIKSDENTHGGEYGNNSTKDEELTAFKKVFPYKTYSRFPIPMEEFESFKPAVEKDQEALNTYFHSLGYSPVSISSLSYRDDLWYNEKDNPFPYLLYKSDKPMKLMKVSK